MVQSMEIVKMFRSLMLVMAMAGLSLVPVAGCQQRVVKTKNSYAGNARAMSAEQRNRNAQDAHLRIRSHQREQAAEHSGNPLAWVGAFFGDLADAIFPPPKPKGLSAKESRPSTSYGGTTSR